MKEFELLATYMGFLIYCSYYNLNKPYNQRDLSI